MEESVKEKNLRVPLPSLPPLANVYSVGKGYWKYFRIQTGFEADYRLNKTTKTHKLDVKEQLKFV